MLKLVVDKSDCHGSSLGTKMAQIFPRWHQCLSHLGTAKQAEHEPQWHSNIYAIRDASQSCKERITAKNAHRKAKPNENITRCCHCIQNIAFASKTLRLHHTASTTTVAFASHSIAKAVRRSAVQNASPEAKRAEQHVSLAQEFGEKLHRLHEL